MKKRVIDDIIDNVDYIYENIAKTFPSKANVACQGIRGAYSQLACDKIFNDAKKKYYNTFEQVFESIEKNECQYGVLPIENSTAGSVYTVYDLLMKYKCSIVRSTKLKINHNLLAKKGASIEQIKEVISHEQALNQCYDYIKKLNNVNVTICKNTALASKIVSNSDRNDIAAISSIECAHIYDLDILDSDIQDKDSNYTRFICISKQMELYSNSNITSLMMLLPHVPGALYKVLKIFYRYNSNLLKIESRPVRNMEEEYMFYFNVEGSIEKENFVKMLLEVGQICPNLRCLGSYSEC